jgi:cellulose synthase/poly-beta-1,6-N-acetylglucosamine synthase-like glycosyltransferase
MRFHQVASLVYVGAGAIWWMTMLGAFLRTRSAVPFVRDFDDPAPAQWPRVSMVIPARNEEDTIEPAVRSHLRDTYPNLEVVLVDDRSTDGTGPAIDRLAAEDCRVVPVHVTELPADWLGKQHAMQAGLERATGTWILFTDADVYATPGCLRRAVARCEVRGLDPLAVIPELRSTGFVLDAVIAQFLRTVLVATRPWAIEDPRTDAGIGAGAFSLVRRSALDRSPGLAWLKLELGDDIALGQMLKSSGAHCSMAMGKGMLDVLFYPNLGAMACAAERAGFTSIGHFNLLRIVAIVVGYWAMEFAPYVAITFRRTPVLPIVGAALVILARTTTVSLNTWAGARAPPAVAQPLGRQ